MEVREIQRAKGDGSGTKKSAVSLSANKFYQEALILCQCQCETDKVQVVISQLKVALCFEGKKRHSGTIH